MKTLSYIVLFVVSALLLQAQGSKKSVWQTATPTEKKNALAFAEEYRSYISKAKTELTSTKEVIEIAEKNGFREFTSIRDIKPGAKVYFNNRNRAIILAVIGKNNIADGSRLIATHHDSPRIDIKAHAAYESNGLVLFKTIYYGGIKKYQWANLPLLLTGRVDLKDGKHIDINIGDNDDEPIFVIPDAAPHVDSPLRERKYTGVFEGEELHPLVASVPGDSTSVLKEMYKRLQAEYGFGEDDFVSAELSLVPALKPRDVGFDKGLLAAYGHDDKLCSFVAVSSITAVNSTPDNTVLAYLTDNEETGSINNTGAQSSFLSYCYAQIAEAQSTQFNDNVTRKALRNALVISADVNDGINPIFPGLSESMNAARVNNGVAIKLYGRSFNANSEMIARFRSMLDDNNIPWQTASYKVESGGGGTIGGFMSKENMEVIDIGIPILSMHSTYEVASKMDIWCLRRAMTAFYQLK
ncbi:MAG: peptidase M18 [Bacteriodetes bacterium]|nr:peptidase M18 [Bacteroidota bacterium]